MNLDMKIHPAVVGLVISLSVIATGIKFWADGEALEYGGPSQLLNDSRGQVYVQIQNQLLEHGADGEFLRRHDLGQLGVDTTIGAIAFFSNGDILLRRGKDTRSFGNKIAAYQRHENKSNLVPDSSGAGLARCNLETRECREFAVPPVDFKSTIGIFVDWQDDDVFVSDTSRHTLRKYSVDGEALAEPVRGFKFPNQLLIAGGQLLVADTNHHKIHFVDPASNSFGRTLRTVDVVPPEAEHGNHRWPSHFARIGDEWWINNMNSGMRNGGIYVFDSDWLYLRRIPLPANADPISILPFAGGALISDWDNDRIYRVTASGAVLDDFESPGLEAVLAESRTARTRYRALSWMGFVLLAAVFIALITKAILSPASEPQVDEQNPEQALDLRSDELIWFEPDPGIVRKVHLNNRLAGGALVGLVAILTYIATAYGDPVVTGRILPLASALVLIYALIYWMARASVGTAIGFQNDDIILRNHKGIESRHPIKKVIYDKSIIATPDMAVVLGQHPMPLYEPKIVTQQLLPRLASARPVSRTTMQRMLIRLRHPQGVMLVVLLAGLVIGGIWYLLR
ncbi:MAG: hypothetical protein OEM51_03135 [Gammaproteobacteria bacterium]|nr:hypothetical protein [Gammaproteobacteria bacterium]MDH3430878.1 hypothetical protein [Gammaproteobacteria bacterium]